MEKEFKIPTGICLEAKRYMKELLLDLAKDKIKIRVRDHGGLTLIADTYNDWIAAREILEKEGTVVKEITARGRVTKPHPSVKIKHDCKSLLRQLYVEYKFTPKSREAEDTQRDLFEDDPALGKFRIVKK